MSSDPEREEIGGYRIVRELGRGGMGLVYEAEHLRLGRNAALKILDPRLADDGGFRERFVQESRLIAAIDHPNIIPIYDAGEVEGVLYIAMRLVDGCDLQVLVDREGPLSPDRALPILEQAAAALDAAHARDLVHRDVKPGNIMIDEPTSRTFLTDFGIAKHGRTRGATQTGLFIGSVDYAPPEQIEGKPTSPAADVYALACVLYQCLTGSRPFDKETDVAVVYAHMLEPPPRVSLLRPDLSPAIDDVVARGMAKQPGERYPACGELVAAARAALVGVADRPAPAVTRFHETTGDAVAGPGAAPLPVPATALVGRAGELERLVDAVRSEGARLVTLTGPGGSGKTRLAVEAARAVEPDFPDGVYFVSLAAVTSAALVGTTLAEALGVEEGEAGDGTEAAVALSLKRRLGSARLLLVLDNFEHVLPAASLVSDLLAGAPLFKVLATSQAALRVQGERELAVPPLELPPADEIDPDALRGYPAVALFVQTARATRPDFELTDDNAVAVAAVCRRLDGLPLALELAAARIKVLTPQAMVARLEDTLGLLKGAGRDRPSRHQTLRSTIDWSYELLEPAEKTLFARLAAFEGGFTLEAAEAVCSFDGGEGDVLDAVESLVDKSLVAQRDSADGGGRFELLRTIQEYGRFRLIEAGEVDLVRRRHTEHYLEVVEGAEGELVGADQAAWVRRLEEEAGNIRAAVEWSLDSGSIETALRMSGALTRFWSVRGHMTEGRGWLRRALGQSEGVRRDVRAKGLFAAGYAALGQGDYDDAIDRFRESLEVFRADEDEEGASVSLAQLGWLLAVRGELGQAADLSEESLALARGAGDRRTASVALGNLAEIRAHEEDPDGAVQLFEEALALRRELGDRRNIANALLNLGRMELIRGDAERAVQLLEEGRELAAEVGDTWGASVALTSLARVALDRGEIASAADLLAGALRACRARGDKRAAAECLTTSAAIAATNGEAVRAARLIGAAESLRTSMGVPPSLLERSLDVDYLSSLPEILGTSLERELEAGRELDLERAVSFALS